MPIRQEDRLTGIHVASREARMPSYILVAAWGIERGRQLILAVGSRIRVVRVSYFGTAGSMQALPHKLIKIETDVMLRVLHAKLDDGRAVTVPRAHGESL